MSRVQLVNCFGVGLGFKVQGSRFKVQGSGFRGCPCGVSPFECVRKRGSGFNRFSGFNGMGRRIKSEAPPSIEISVKNVPPLKKGVPEGQGIDCLEEAEFCRM
ncbi:MAG: hypothetical protein MR569_05310, partial [Dialister sp.]|nr:hypothetical protein [Dialister sp.]